MKLFKEIKGMLSSDSSDRLSSKRVITFLAFLAVTGAFITNLIWGKNVDTNMFDGLIQIVWAGLGVVVGEHLLKNKHTNSSQKENEKNNLK